MVTALCGSFCIACLRPLTRRYVAKEKYGNFNISRTSATRIKNS
nr:hypothetical protein [Vibrio parahaemolyticus]